MEPRDTGNRHVETREFVDGATVPDTSRAQSFPGKEIKKRGQKLTNQSNSGLRNQLERVGKRHAQMPQRYTYTGVYKEVQYAY